MFNYNHRIKSQKLLAFWEPGLFALPGVLFLWAALVALHRLASREAEGNMVLVYVCIVILLSAGLGLCGARFGVAFAPKDGKWGYWIGLFRPFLFFWHPLSTVEGVVVTAEREEASQQFYLLSLQGARRTALGATESGAAAASMGESLAAFIGKPLLLGGEREGKKDSRTPYWGQLSHLAEKPNGSKLKLSGNSFNIPSHFLSLRGRGPILLSLFLAAVLILNLRPLQLTSSFWGVALCVLVCLFCAWAFISGINSLLRTGGVVCEKKSIKIEEKGLWKTQRTFKWNDLCYLALLPPRKGFLELAGRSACITLGDREASKEIGESLGWADLLKVRSFLVQKARKGSN